tara:strand:+ start:550 stop:693 length:144 start_codon:yes stop_codon:yes gene_type:complete
MHAKNEVFLRSKGTTDAHPAAAHALTAIDSVAVADIRHEHDLFRWAA